MKTKLFISLVCLFLTFTFSACSDTSNEDLKPSDLASQADEAAIEGNHYERPYSPSIGLATAKVTIVEFFDPACEACRAFYPVVKEILSRHPKDVRVVLRYAAFHEGSETVVRMLETARLQNVFEPVLDALIKDQQEWASHHKPNINRAWEIAEAAGLNVESTKATMNSAHINQVLTQDKKDIGSLGVRQTPTFFVNEQALTAFGAQQLYDLVISELEK